MSKKRNISKRVKNNEGEDPSYYISLANTHYFPSWFSLSKDGNLTIPLNKLKSRMSFENFKKTTPDNYGLDYLDGFDDEVIIFDYENQIVGQDFDFLYTLSKIIMTPTVNKNGDFAIALIIYPKIRPSRRRITKECYKIRLYEYGINCPIWQ